MTDSTELKLAAAIATPDDDVNLPSRVRSSSFAAVIGDLHVGETASRVVQIDPTLPLGEVTGNLAKWREELRNNTASSMRQAMKKTAGEYTIEIDDHLSAKGKLFLLALVTRVG